MKHGKHWKTRFKTIGKVPPCPTSNHPQAFLHALPLQLAASNFRIQVATPHQVPSVPFCSMENREKHVVFFGKHKLHNIQEFLLTNHVQKTECLRTSHNVSCLQKWNGKLHQLPTLLCLQSCWFTSYPNIHPSFATVLTVRFQKHASGMYIYIYCILSPNKTSVAFRPRDLSHIWSIQLKYCP